jgi:hypothetical protein
LKIFWSKNPHPGEGFEKSFYLMRRSPVRFFGLNTAGIPFIFGQLIKVTQPPTDAINHNAQDLFEKPRHAKPFSILPEGCKPAIDPSKNLNAMQTGHEQGQPGSSGQPIGSGFNALNFEFFLPAILLSLFIESST